MNIGLKYRYFQSDRLDFTNDFGDFSTSERAPVHLAQPAGEPDLQLRRSGDDGGPAASASAAAARAGTNADLPRRIGDPGVERLPGSAASASAAAGSGRAR